MKEKTTNVSTRDKILQVTVDLIKSEDISSVTVRKVAELADVNIGAVNYHYQSKEKLVNLATKKLLQPFQDTFQYLDKLEIPPQERLKQFLLAFAETIQRFPEPVKRLISTNSLMSEFRQEFSQYLKESGRTKVFTTISEVTGETDQNKLVIISMQIFSAIVFPILLVPGSDSLKEAALPDIEIQVETLVEILAK